MRRLFAPDSAFMRIMSKATDLIAFNLLFLLCALPLVTLGASLCALYTMTFRMSRGEAYGIRDFFTAFRENFKQATAVWLCMLTFLLMLWVNYRFFLHTAFTGQVVVWVIMALCALLWLVVFCWVFPLLSQFSDSIRHSVVNAMLFGFSQAPKTLLMGLLLFLPLLLFTMALQWFIQLIMVWLLLWFSLSAYGCAYLMKPVFSPYRVVRDAKSEENSKEHV